MHHAHKIMIKSTKYKIISKILTREQIVTFNSQGELTFLVKQDGYICPKLLQDPTPDVPASLLFGIPEPHTVEKNLLCLQQFSIHLS